MKNTGKPTEEAFEKYVASLGKAAFVHRFVDAAEVRGRTGSIGQTRKAPADYLLTHKGVTSYVEVKSTVHETRFQFSLLRTNQSATAKMALAAGGSYLVVIHAINQDRWFWVPYSDLKVDTRRSMTWEELTPWERGL